MWDLPCVQQASYLEGGPLMWMLPLYLHVNQKSNYDDGMHVFTALKGHTFYNLFTLARKQGFAKHSSSLNK